MLLSCYYPQMTLRMNEGTRSAPLFSTNITPIMVEGKPHYLELPQKQLPTSTSPAITDWDGDGLHDLLICLFIKENKVIWHRNIGKKGQPNFSKPEVLLDFSKTGKPKTCNRLDVEDFNNDGKLDLIIGGGYFISNSKKDSGAWIYLQK